MNILLTGASTGIGFETVKTLLKHKDINKIVIITKNEIAFADDRVEVHNCNLSNRTELNNIMENINFSDIDVFIANAGFGKFDFLENLADETILNMLQVNLIANFQIIKKCLPFFKKAKHGKIILISSDADKEGFAGASAYCASKFGLLGLSKALRKEITGYNIGLTTISPGRVDTNFNNKKKGDRPNSLMAIDIAEIIEFIIWRPERCNIEAIDVASLYEEK